MTTTANRIRAALAALALCACAGHAGAADGVPGRIPVPVPVPKPAEITAADAARAALIERLKGAAQAGIVAFPDPAAPPAELAADAVEDEAGRTVGEQAQDTAAAGHAGIADDAGLLLRSDAAPREVPVCRDDAEIAAALSGPAAPLPPLAGEFDRIDAEALDAHVRAALSQGLGAEALFLLRAFPEAHPDRAPLYGDVARILDARPGAAQNALVRAHGCTGLHALLQAAAHAGIEAAARDAAASAAAAQRAGEAGAALPLPVRQAIGPHVVTAALDAGDPALAQTLSVTLLVDLPAADGWVRLAKARLDAAAGRVAEARAALLALAESQHPAAVPAALAAAPLVPAGDPEDARIEQALDRAVHLMRNRPEAERATAIRVRRKIDAGTPAAALEILKRAPHGEAADLLRLAALDAIAARETLPAGERAVLLYTHLAALPDTVPGIADTLTHAAWLFAALAQPAIAAELEARRARIAGDAPVLTAEEATPTPGADAASLGQQIDARTQAAGEAVTGPGLPGRVRTALARARATESAILEVQRP